jgi:hypothetical protein
VDDHYLRLHQHLHLVGELQVRHAQVLAELEVRDVDHDLLGDVGRQALDLELARHEVDDASLQLDADRGALELDVHLDGEQLVERPS